MRRIPGKQIPGEQISGKTPARRPEARGAVLAAALAALAWLPGCVTEDPYPRRSLVEHFEGRRELRDRLVRAIEALDCVRHAEVVFGEDHLTGSEQIVVIVTPVEGIYDRSREQAIIDQVAQLSGRPRHAIALFRSTH